MQRPTSVANWISYCSMQNPVRTPAVTPLPTLLCSIGTLCQIWSETVIFSLLLGLSLYPSPRMHIVLVNIPRIWCNPYQWFYQSTDPPLPATPSIAWIHHLWSSIVCNIHCMWVFVNLNPWTNTLAHLSYPTLLSRNCCVDSIFLCTLMLCLLCTIQMLASFVVSNTPFYPL